MGLIFLADFCDLNFLASETLDSAIPLITLWIVVCNNVAKFHHQLLVAQDRVVSFTQFAEFSFAVILGPCWHSLERTGKSTM